MGKIWRAFMWLFVLSGFPLLAWAFYYFATETYAFWRHGVEKSAFVVGLDHFSRSGRSGSTTYYYEIEMDGRRTINEFNVCLPVGKRVPVLVLPNKPDAVTPGTSNSSLFSIFSNMIGGDLIAVLTIGMFGFMAWAGPKALAEWIRARKDIIDGPSRSASARTRRTRQQ